MLLHKSRTIMAVNKLGAAGGIRPDVPCFALTRRTSICPHCEANESVRDKEGRRAISYNCPMRQLRDCYWIPLVGHEDFYVHLGIDITSCTLPDLCEQHKKVAEAYELAEASQKKCLKKIGKFPLPLIRRQRKTPVHRVRSSNSEVIAKLP